MRVLWLTPEQLPAATGGEMTAGGWLEGLRAALEDYVPEIDLGIASQGSRAHAPFKRSNATYFHIAGPAGARGRMGRAMRDWAHDVAPSVSLDSIRDIAQAFAPDLVHVHGSEHYLALGVIGGVAPVVVSLQGLAVACQHYMFSGFRNGEIIREVATKDFARGAGIFHEWWTMRKRAACEEQILAGCDDFIGRTAWDRAFVHARRPAARYYHVDEILDQVFYDTAWRPDGQATIVSTTGSLPSKGVEVLLDAVSILRLSYGADVRLRLLGASVGSGSLHRPLERRLARPELAECVTLLGRQGPRRVAEELGRATVFVQPSHIENSSNSLCEAMLVGLPCVAAHVGGLPSLVEDDVTGVLYHDRDEYALADALAGLLRDPARSARLGKAARRTASVRHDRRTVAEGTATVYRTVMQANAQEALEADCARRSAEEAG